MKKMKSVSDHRRRSCRDGSCGATGKIKDCVTIIEKSDKLGGRLNQWHALFPARKPATSLLNQLKSSVTGVNVVYNAVVTGVERNDDGFAIHINHNRMITANALLLTRVSIFLMLAGRKNMAMEFMIM